MHGSLAFNQALLAHIRDCPGAAHSDIVVCPPAIYLPQCQSILTGSPIAWGAQDISRFPSGAYTGEHAPEMLKEFGCQYAIVGHSERRSYHAENDDVVAEKAAAAIGADIRPIVCVGETLDQREKGETEAVVASQIDAVLKRIAPDHLDRLVLAYEPVWAIGTGKTATPAMAQDVHALIRERLARESRVAAAKVRILYGGSMKPENAAELLAMPDIDGGLIGGAALKAQDFLAIIGCGGPVKGAPGCAA